MRLRIARKMDTGDWRRRERQADRKPDHRPWWSVYNAPQLERAERRLRKRWRRSCPAAIDDRGIKYRDVSDDFFAANRIEARRQQQTALFRWWRREEIRLA